MTNVFVMIPQQFDFWSTIWQAILLLPATLNTKKLVYCKIDAN